MIKPKIPANEKERLAALRSYAILDTEMEYIFDSLTKLAASVCDVPVCLLSLVDENRQWMKSTSGIKFVESPRDTSFCGHTINQTDVLYVQDATKDERFFDNPFVTSDMQLRFYAGNPLIDENGYALGALCLIDYTPRTLSAQKLESLRILSEQAIYLIKSRGASFQKEQAYSMLSQLSDNLPGFIFTFQLFSDGSSCFPFCSSKLAEVFEVDPADVRTNGSKIMARLHPNDLELFTKKFQESAQTMTRLFHEYRIVLPNSGIKWVRTICNPEKATNGSTLWHGYIYDISEIKAQEDLMQNSSKMAALGEMAAGIAHEINNPLAIIKASAQLFTSAISRKEYDEQKMLKYLAKINQTTDRISKIVRGLKFFSDPAQGDKFNEESFFSILDETLSLCHERFKVNGVELMLNYPPEMESLRLECHAVEISQVILNLLNNAFDAIEKYEVKWIKLEVQNSHDYITFSITDCGHGIKLEEVQKMLVPFYTTKEAGKGTGLGLTIIKKIIDAHGGNIAVDSNCKNTKFDVRLPKNQIQKKIAS